MWLDDLAAEDDPEGTLVDEAPVSRPQVDAVIAYRRTYPAEITARIALHRLDTAAAADR